MFSESLEPRSGNWAEEPGWGTGSNSANSSLLHLGANEILFETGDPRTCLYRVELGAVVLHEQRWNGHHGVIDFAFPGDLVGLGFLDTHSCCARAVIDTYLTCLPVEEQSRAVDGDGKAQAKLDEAIERDFEYRRSVALGSKRRSCLNRVAAFLVCMSRINAREGRDPRVVADSCTSEFVAELLGLKVEQLATLLLELRWKGLIQPCPGSGLQLKDIEALEELAG